MTVSVRAFNPNREVVMRHPTRAEQMYAEHFLGITETTSEVALSTAVVNQSLKRDLMLKYQPNIIEKFLAVFSIQMSREALPQQIEILQSCYEDFRALGKDLSNVVTQVMNPPKILKPHTEMLERIASHYEKKYNISIKIVSSLQEFEAVVQGLLEKKEQKPVGIIVDPNRNHHVFSVIVDLRDSTGLILDVLDSSESEATVAYENILKSEGVKLAASFGKRQIDIYSCRTEATVMLRNLLLYLRLHSEKTLGNMISDCALQYPVGNCIERRDIKRIFLPAECCYIDQIRPGWNGFSDKAIPVRRLFSKQEDKKASKESAKEFISRFTFPVKVNRYCYNFLDDQHLVKLQGFQAFENANSEHFKYKSPDLAVWVSGYDKVYIRMRYAKPLYQYLVLKSYRNARSYDPLHSLAMPNMTSEQD